ncbi:uncharacterized protein LOC113070500 [Carassius auratus]|uniref:Uncharacterized protein LOC113070500 n=1 Tax=Carassius auratus TaxID=7957 RepID=A0A6P6MSC2_CARAU|nr:uncharacterized protein LOC113070500 [Carassius auratus]
MDMEIRDAEFIENSEEIPDDDECPWPHLEELFTYRGRKGDSVQMQCKLCLPSAVISAYKTSASNLKKHIMRKHPSKIDQYNDIVTAAARSQRKTTATPNKLSSSKQAKLPDVMLAAASKRVPQTTVDKLIINFICESVQPFTVVEQPAFKELITTLQPQAKVISRSTVRTRICDAADDMKKTLIAELGKPKFVATTTDYAVINFFMARTEKIRQVGFDSRLARVGHLAFLIDGLSSLHVDSCDDIIISHVSKIKAMLPWGQSETDKAYSKFRYWETC